MGRTTGGQRQKRKKRLKKRKGAGASSWAERMRRAGRWPLLECRVSADLRETGLAQVLIAREGPAGIAIGFFLVDLGCLGVKNCMREDDLTQDEYDSLVEQVAEQENVEPCEPAFAVKVVQAGVRYAAELGFRPQSDYAAAREIFGDIDPDQCRDEVPCGRDGRPLYVEGPDDDVPAILRRLEERLGPDGFGYVSTSEQVSGDWVDGGFPGEDDPDPNERLWGRMRRAEARLVRAILQYAKAHCGPSFLEQARAEFDWITNSSLARTGWKPGRGGSSRPSTRRKAVSASWSPAGTPGATRPRRVRA